MYSKSFYVSQSVKSGYLDNIQNTFLRTTTELIHKRKHEAEFSFGFHFTAVVNLQFMAFGLRTGQEDVL